MVSEVGHVSHNALHEPIPSSQWLAERMVRTVKGQLEYSSDPYESLLSYTSPMVRPKPS